MMKSFRNIMVVLISGVMSLSALESSDATSSQAGKKGPLKVELTAELGFLSVLDHKIQFGRGGTYFDYNKTGGQDVLFPFNRLSINTQWKRNTFVLLYQPLGLETEELVDRDLVIDGMTFPAQSGVKFFYNFPFYRFSYLYEVVPEGQWNVGLGVSLQIRNATITFESTDGERFRTNRDLGLVPALKARIRYNLNEMFWLATELDGIYAPVSYLNGDDNDVTGAILDASIRAGYTHNKGYTAFLNVRYIGGGAEGQSDNYEFPSDGYVKNWLHFLAVSVGFSWEIF